VSFTMPPTSDDAVPEVDVEPVYGVTVNGVERIRRSRFVLRLGLPKPLAAGEEHEYAVITRPPTDQPMRQHLVYFPERRCDEFDLRVRFDQSRLPEQVWRMAEAFPRDVDEIRPSDEILVPDLVGEVRVTFDHPRVGFGYGAQWVAGS
jgi:hypothetical protein